MEEEKKDVKKQDTVKEEKTEKATKPAEAKKEEPKKEEKKEVKQEAKKEKKTESKTENKVETKKEAKKLETAKTTSTTSTNKNSNKGIIAVVAIVVVVALLIYAYFAFMVDSPKKAVNDMLRDVKSGKYQETALAEELDEEQYNDEVRKAFFDKLSWKISKVSEEGDKATVEVEITNKDFKTILGNYMQKAIQMALSGGDEANTEEMQKYLMEELNNKDVQNTTTNQTINVEKKDGKWQVSDENDFMSILLPGFSEVINTLS